MDVNDCSEKRYDSTQHKQWRRILYIRETIAIIKDGLKKHNLKNKRSYGMVIAEKTSEETKEEVMRKKFNRLEKVIEDRINIEGIDSMAGVPDFLLASFMVEGLKNFMNCHGKAKGFEMPESYKNTLENEKAIMTQKTTIISSPPNNVCANH